MQKLVLLSIIIMTMAIPLRASRARSLGEAFRVTIRWMAAYCVLYLLLLIYVYPRLEAGK
jgi:hypothetical protein